MLIPERRRRELKKEKGFKSTGKLKEPAGPGGNSYGRDGAREREREREWERFRGANIPGRGNSWSGWEEGKQERKTSREGRRDRGRDVGREERRRREETRAEVSQPGEGAAVSERELTRRVRLDFQSS